MELKDQGTDRPSVSEQIVSRYSEALKNKQDQIKKIREEKKLADDECIECRGKIEPGRMENGHNNGLCRSCAMK